MTATIPTCEPTQFTAGDSLAWTKTLANYPPSEGWTLHYRFVGKSPFATDPVVAVVNGVYSVTLAASVTANENFIPGSYQLTGWVDGVSSESHEVFRDFVEILPNLRVATYEQLLTHNERMLAAIEERLESRVEVDVERYGREGLEVNKIPFEELREAHSVYAAKVSKENGGGFIMHAVAFAQPGRSSSAWPN